MRPWSPVFYWSVMFAVTDRVFQRPWEWSWKRNVGTLQTTSGVFVYCESVFLLKTSLFRCIPVSFSAVCTVMCKTCWLANCFLEFLCRWVVGNFVICRATAQKASQSLWRRQDLMQWYECSLILSRFLGLYIMWCKSSFFIVYISCVISRNV